MASEFRVIEDPCWRHCRWMILCTSMFIFMRSGSWRSRGSPVYDAVYGHGVRMVGRLFLRSLPIRQWRRPSLTSGARPSLSRATTASPTSSAKATPISLQQHSLSHRWRQRRRAPCPRGLRAGACPTAG